MNTERTFRYTPTDYDGNFALKLNLPAWLIIAFIMRPFLVFIASVSDRTNHFGLLNIIYSDHIWALLSAFASIPTIVLLIAWINRGPHAGLRIRRIWNQGRELLTVSLLLNIVAYVTPLLLDAKVSHIAKLQIGLCSVFLLILWRSTRIHDTFSDFPSDSTKITLQSPSS